MSFSVKPVESQEDLAATIRLFEAYAKSLAIDLSFQDFATEMASMPGKYGPPTGALLLARRTDDRKPVGCVGLRQLETGICEMKRLYVDPAGRGLGVGKALASAVVREARLLGYGAMRLDTLPAMTAARAMYERLGFREIEQYYQSPVEGTIFLELIINK